MAVFSVEIADADVARVLTAIASNYRRPDQVNNPDYDPADPDQQEKIDNPETLAQFSNRIVRQFLSENVESYETSLARQQAISDLDTSVTINDPAA